MPQRSSNSSVFTRIGRRVCQSRSWVIGLWISMMILSLALSPQLEGLLKGAGLTYRAGEAMRTERLIQENLGISADPIIAVFQSTDPAKTQPLIEGALTKIRQLPAVSTVGPPAQSPSAPLKNPDTQYSVIGLKQSDSESAALLQIKEILDSLSSQTLKTEVTGKAAVDQDVLEVSKTDLARAELIALPLTLIAMLFVFGSVVAAMLPIAMGILTVSVTFGLLYFAAQQIEMSALTLNFTTMLGLGLGIDYSLLIVNRFREELHHGSVSQAIVRTVDTAGRAVFVSGITVCISLFCLLLFPISVLRSIGIAGFCVVLLSVAAALTLLPALLALLGHRVNRGQQADLPRTGSGFWSRVAGHVTRHSGVSIAAVLAVVLLLSAPTLQMRFGLGDASVLPSTVSSRVGIEQIQQQFGPGEVSPIFVLVQTARPTDSILSPQHLATLYATAVRLGQDPRVANVTSLLNANPQLPLASYQALYRQPLEALPPPIAAAVRATSSRNALLLLVRSKTQSHDEDSMALVKELRSLKLLGLTVQVGGQTAREIDLIGVVIRRFPAAVAGVFFVTFVVLCLLLRSIVLPIKAILMNVLSIGASFGALVFIFQEGHLKKVLNFTPLGYLDIMLPLILFCVVFGLSMDYEVFLLTRIREAYEDCGDNTQSVIEGLERTGRIITSAASLMIIVTGVFTFTSIIFMRALGLGIALAVLIDATLIRIILVPATMQLMGRWNWWVPKWMSGIQAARH